MALDTFVLLANQYDSEADALADFEAVRKLYTDLGIIDTYDAAVLCHSADGKVNIIKRVEEPTRHGGAIGLVVGLAVGAAVALFPPLGVGLGAGLLGGGAFGAGAGAIVGHVAGGMRRSDLKELGEFLDKGKCALLVAAATDMEAKVDAAITRTKKRAKARLQTDTDALKREIDAIHA
ncbi:hypothetical protein [Pedosphaera parvula]|uniref:DUF1269 domain-containing protein n=1 Tax=Pedosphaera parvula (strain Ellin514) TaxID=320771 RepID=B9XHG3_PEDPL|nr:hypothetical protein [Pedosphaera parvula]EEF60798.1 conserved hypothetical protein [Pedosphaera parvula Ellin514]